MGVLVAFMAAPSVTAQELSASAKAEKTGLEAERKKAESSIKSLDTQIVAKKRVVENLLDAIERGTDLGTVKSRLSKANGEIRTLEARKADLAVRIAEIDGVLGSPRFWTIEKRLAAIEAALAKPAAEAEDDFDGPEPALEDTLEIAVSITSVLQGTSGADEDNSTEGNITDANYIIDVEVQSSVGKNGTAYACFEAGNGGGIDGEIATLSGINTVAVGDADLGVLEAWYEHRLFNDKLAIQFGKIDLSGACGAKGGGLDTNAVANDECGQFLSSALVNNLAIEFPDDNGPGVAIWYTVTDNLNIGLGVADTDADWENVFDDTFTMIELDLTLDISGRSGTYRFYGWRNDADHEDVRDATRSEQSGYGGGISFDQELGGGVVLFGRFARQRQTVYDLAGAWSVGVQLPGSIFGRDDDHIGLAFARTMLSDYAKDALEGAGVDPEDEGIFEVYYNATVNDNISVSPGYQVIVNPSADSDADAVSSYWLRMALSF